MMADTLDESRSNDALKAPTFIKISEVNTISRARALRLSAGDIIIGVNGAVYAEGITEFKIELEECDEELGLVLTVWRAGTIFNVIALGPLGATLEIAGAEESEKISSDLVGYNFAKRDDLHIYEVLRNLYRHCEIIDTNPQPTAAVIPALWLAQNRLLEPLLAVLSIYAITFVVHWALFVITYVILCLYFKRGSLMLLRSFIIYKEYQMWMVVAARDLKEVQHICRQIDPKSQFRNSLVGEPVIEEAPKKKRRRSSIPGM